MSELGYIEKLLGGVTVERKPLGDTCKIFSGYAFESKLFNTERDGLPLIRIRDVNTGFSETYYSGEYDKRYVVDDGDILIGMDGDFKAARWKHGTALLNQRVCRLQDFVPEILPSFLFYLVQDELDRIHKKIQGSTVKHLSSRELAQALIPVPTLKTQAKIVRILDAFTALTAELNAELTAELSARKKQYNYYRDKLLSFEDGEVEWKPLGEVGVWYGGGTPSKQNPTYWENGTIPWVSPKDMGASIISSSEDYITEVAVRESSTKLVPEKAVVLVVRSSILDKRLPSALTSVPVSLNQDMKAVVTHPDILPNYLSHVMRSRGDDILRAARKSGGSVASIDSKKLFSFRIPVPNLAEQLRIIEILNKFDSIANSITEGLPREIELRQKQYEYYRDLLLSFPKPDEQAA